MAAIIGQVQTTIQLSRRHHAHRQTHAAVRRVVPYTVRPARRGSNSATPKCPASTSPSVPPAPAKVSITCAGRTPTTRPATPSSAAPSTSIWPMHARRPRQLRADIALGANPQAEARAAKAVLTVSRVLRAAVSALRQAPEAQLRVATRRCIGCASRRPSATQKLERGHAASRYSFSITAC